MAAQCPFLTPEFKLIKENHSTLASTGCTRDFCQAGRAIHTDEPRVGENRALHVVEEEAEGFLRELYQEDFFESEEAFQDRLQRVLYEIRNGAVEGTIRETKEKGMVGGVWTQTTRELEFGLRRAWRNVRKCVMRSHCEDLRVYDLRSVTSSAKMAVELIRGVSEGFNDGNIIPSIFVFPPRTPNNRGPMIWNDQIVQFAGYEQEDGTILGDPKTVKLTKDILDLGWEPPKNKTKWDILPIVTMAEGDLPVIAELPSHLRLLVEIRHPKYQKAFEKLDLKWLSFPALSRLGSDIGGVQYTAAPFMGWFMDAEIGVRNLADSFRYNVLPDVIQALRLDDGALLEVDSFDDLPEYEKLAMLSRAQTELTYAVQYSFIQAKVTINDTLTASMKWTKYDDEFQKKHGYRLPSDPYWLAPPQGSIIPLWHRGAAPNYQPKPMISRHVQDPAKAWKREKDSWPVIATKVLSTEAIFCSLMPPARALSKLARILNTPNQAPVAESRAPIPQRKQITNEVSVGRQNPAAIIEIYYCSAGTIAEKLATKLRDKAQALSKSSLGASVMTQVKPLNDLEVSDITPDKIFLMVVSSTGLGDIPANGADFSEMCDKILGRGQTPSGAGFRFAVFGNGDSRYVSTYNAAATKINQQLIEMGGIALTAGPFLGDTALQSPPWSALTAWWEKVQPAVSKASQRSRGTH